MAFQPAGAGPAVADVEGVVLIQRQRAGIARQPAEAALTALAPCSQAAGRGRSAPDAAAAEVGDVEGLGVLVQRKAGRSGNAAHHLLHGAGSGIINVYRACSGVGQQLGAQGTFQPLFRALLPDHGKVDLAVRTDFHGRKGSQRGTVDLRDHLLHRSAPTVVPGAAKGAPGRGEDCEPQVSRSIKCKAGQLALYAQDDRSVAAVGAHQIAGAFFQGGAVPCRRIDKAIPGADAVHTLIPAQIPDLPAVGGKRCLRRAGGLPVIRGGVGFGRGLNGPEHQRPDQRSNRGQRKHDAQFLEPLEHFLPLGGTLGLLHGPAAGSGGAGPVGAAKPAVYPQGCTGANGQ